MTPRETVKDRKERLARTICKCGHCQSWHSGKVTHRGGCSFPGCHCSQYKHDYVEQRR